MNFQIELQNISPNTSLDFSSTTSPRNAKCSPENPITLAVFTEMGALPSNPSTPLKRRKVTESTGSSEGNALLPINSAILNQPRCSTPSPTTQFRISSYSSHVVEPDIIEQITYNGSPFSISPLINFGHSGRAVVAKGCHSVAYIISPGQKEVAEGIENDSLAIKVPYNVPHQRYARPTVTRDSVYQYRQCLHNGIPVAEIFNIDTCITDGFVIQRKVKPFTEAPWSESDPIEDILNNPTKNSYLNQIIELSSSCFINMGNCGIDLKWDNLGLQLDGDTESRDTLILFDFLEDMDAFYLNFRHLLNLLSNRNNDVLEIILSGVKSKLEEAVEANKLTYENGIYYSEEGGKKIMVAFDETFDGTGFWNR